MSNINNYRYTLTTRRGVKTVYPLGEGDFTISWANQTSGKRYYKTDLPNNVIFFKDAYDTLYKLETSVYRCEYIKILVERRCTLGGLENWAPWFTGRFLLNSGSFDLDREQVVIKVDDLQDYSCFDDNNTLQLNLFDFVTNRYQVNTYPPNTSVEKIDKTSVYLSSEHGRCVGYAWDELYTAESVGFTPYYNEIRTDWVPDPDNPMGPGSPVPYTCTIHTSYARQKMVVACGDPSPGSDWILLTDTCPGGEKTYVRGVGTYGCTLTDETPDLGGYLNQIWNCLIVGDSDTITTIDNGMLLSDCLQLFLNQYCGSILIKSNFLQINPDVVSPNNYVTGELSKTANVLVFQKSDVKRPNVSGNATIAQIDWTDLLTYVVTLYNLAWRFEYDETGAVTVFRLEHVSYYDPGVGLDLTQPKYAKYMNNLRRYSYNNPSIPAQETFSFMEAVGADFVGLPIVYDAGCVTAESSQNNINYALSNLTTEVALCLSNPPSDSSIVSDDGFVFIACQKDGDGNFFIVSESGIFSGSALNNSLAWAQLHRDYWKYERPVKVGNMNGAETTFISIIPTKKGDVLTIPLCCGDTFDPSLKVLTPLGIGKVDSAVYSFKSNTLQLSLLYDANLDLTTNTPPVAGNLTESVYQPESIDIDVLAVCSDVDPDSYFTAVNIIYPPLHGHIDVLDNMHVRYTPDVGYIGTDSFVYEVLDDWSEPSNPALVAINVYGEYEAFTYTFSLTLA
jgi:hypothetical protein